MKLHKFIQSTAAAAVASAMMLSIAMPVLAETLEPSDAQNRSIQATGVLYEANDAAGEDTALRQTSVGGYGIAVNGTPVTKENKDDILKNVENIAGKLSYDPENHVLTGEGRIAGKSDSADDRCVLEITIEDGTEAPVDVKLNGSVSVMELKITGARNVTASTDVSGQTLLNVSTLTIGCSGDLELVNNGDSSVVSANTVNLTSGGVMTLRGSCISSVLGGTSATLSSGGLLSIENSGSGRAVSCGTIKVENAGGVSVKGGVSGGSGTIKNCTGDVELSANGNYAWSVGRTNINCSGSLKVNGSTAAGNPLFSSSETMLNCGGDLIIENTGSGQAVSTGSFTVKKAQDVKISGSTGSTLLSGSFAVKLCDVGNVTIENTGSGSVISGGGFTVENAADVVISGKSSFVAISGGSATTINCTGSVKVENTGSGMLFNSAETTVTCGGKMDLYGKADQTLINTADATLKANGALTIQNTGTSFIASCNSISLTSGGKISVSGNSSVNALLSGSTVTIECGDDLTIENAGTSNVVNCGAFTVKRAKDVTLGSINCGGTEITCSGKVTAAAAAESDRPAVSGPLTYTQSENKAYEVKAGTDSESAEVLPDTGEEGTKFTMLNKDYKYLCITPEGWVDLPDLPDIPGSDAPDTDGSGSAMGAVVAGVAIGGTVLFVGYEVVTDIILGDLLPEGAAVPVNRGQLAVQIWTNAGRPEPEHQPVFTDVNDAETAKAAQWCVEQGFLSAESGSFRPDSWTPKFRVIEVWKKAFPQT